MKNRHKLQNLKHRLLHDNEGATALEFAFVGPLIIISIFGFIAAGLFFFSNHQAQMASERAARSVRMMDLPSEEQILAELNRHLPSPLGGSYNSSVTKIDEHGGTYADIRITYNFPLKVPFIANDTLTIESGTRILLRDFQ